MGDDSDTVGANYGQIAGAYYGGSQIPISWIQSLTFLPLLEAYSRDLFQLAQGNPGLQANESLYSRFASMETGYRLIHKKMSPGPSMYSSVGNFDDDTSQFLSQFSSDCEGFKRLSEDYQRRFEAARMTVLQRTSRPAFSFGKK